MRFVTIMICEYYSKYLLIFFINKIMGVICSRMDNKILTIEQKREKEIENGYYYGIKGLMRLSEMRRK